MNFKEAIYLSLEKKGGKYAKAGANLRKSEEHEHPFLWKAFQHRVTKIYENDTGETIGANFDWSTIMEWLIANLPALLKLLMMIFAL